MKEKNQRMGNFACYYCNFSTDFEDVYLKHGVTKHYCKPLFPNESEMIKYELEPQNRKWEKPYGTLEEAKERLAKWAEKRRKQEHENPPEEQKEVTTYWYTSLDDYGK